MPTQDVDTLITNAENAAAEALDGASVFINALKGDLFEGFYAFVPGSNSWNIATDSNFETAINGTPTRPTGLEYAGVGSLGDAPIPSIRDPDFPVVPAVTSAAPDVNIPTAPTVDVPPVPSEPAIVDPTIPAAPDLNLPDTPVLADVELPVTPELVLPVFDQTFPVEPDFAFDGNFSYTEPDFVTDLLTQLDGRLLDDLTNGATGLFDEEDGLFSRQRDRFARAGMERERKAYVAASARGFQLPTGVLEAMLDEARDEAQQQLSEAERDIFLLRADLIRKTREFMITSSISLEQMLITHFGFRQERILKAAQFAAEFAKKVFDISVERYKIQIDAFQAFTQSYSERVRAVLGQTEIFRNQLEASRIRGEVNEQQIRIYLAQFEASKTLVALFNAQMQSAQIEASINQSRIQAFAERTRAYVSQIDGQRMKLDVFDSQIKGEAAKVEVYKAQVQTDAIQVNAVETQARIEGLKQNADIETAKIEFQVYAVQIEEFKARLDQEVARVRTLVDVYGTDVAAYTSNIDGWSSFYSLAERTREAFMRQISEETKIGQEQSRQVFEQLATVAKHRSDASKEGVMLYRDLVAAARASIQSIASKEEVV